jgi:hypothetical protein
MSEFQRRLQMMSVPELERALANPRLRPEGRTSIEIEIRARGGGGNGRDRGTMDLFAKSQIPNPKPHGNPNAQASNWCLVLPWCLGFGAWCFSGAISGAISVAAVL